jgi:hypothetical protein
MSRKKREMAIHAAPKPVVVNGKWARALERREVTVMARADGYAMVRRKGCLPYVAPEKELHAIDASPAIAHSGRDGE